MIDGKYYDRLRRLTLAVDKKSNAALLGSRKSVRKGSSAEFSDFREYMPGDDIRSIDWNAYARLDRLYIKEYMEEKESRITFFLDMSRSMDYGEYKKSELLKDLTNALSYVALMHMDHVAAVDLSDPGRIYSVSGGMKGFRDICAWLDRLEITEGIDMTRSIRITEGLQPGMSIILSDFLSEEFVEGEALENIIKYLNYRKQKVVVLQLLAEEETDISLTGTHNLIDSEDKDRKVKVTMDSASIRQYDDALKEFTSKLKNCCKKYGALYHLINTGENFDKVVFDELRDIYE